MDKKTASTLFLTMLFVAAPAVAQARSSAPCPHDMAQVGESCVDKYEGSLVEVHSDGAESAFSAYETPAGRSVRAVSREGVAPQAHISMNDAQKACHASGKRLCHAREWKTACKGPEQTRYPYGNTRVANACVDTDRTSPVLKLHQGLHDATTMNDPALNQQENTVEPTGAAAACTNAFGVHDMVGNVHEWADDGAFHGGYYLDTEINGEGCEYTTTAHSKSYYDYSTGFRCCADAGSMPDDEEPDAAVSPATSATAPVNALLQRPVPTLRAPLRDAGSPFFVNFGRAPAQMHERRRSTALTLAIGA